MESVSSPWHFLIQRGIIIPFIFGKNDKLGLSIGDDIVDYIDDKRCILLIA